MAAIEPSASVRGEGLARFWASRLKHRLDERRLGSPDRVFGNRWSGAMTTQRLIALLSRLAPGITEIYMHPATRAGFAGSADGYGYRAELTALTSCAVRDALTTSGATSGGYLDALR